jgi:GT2 family glycosyltransferase
VVTEPALSAVVVHWRTEEALERLVASWPRDENLELLIVDNGSRRSLSCPGARVLDPGRNLGFAGGANFGLAQAASSRLLILNPDIVPQEQALQSLLEGFAQHPEAAGLIPALEGPGGQSQTGWQLKRLPRPGDLLLQTLLPVPVRGARTPPKTGQAVEQPAAAALALTRASLELLGGFDPAFHPAWFEDVDLARRAQALGLRFLYWPRSRFTHLQGATVPELGYGPFLHIYYRNLRRYLEKHHGRAWAGATRWTLPIGALLRLSLVPLRRPRRASSRKEAAQALLSLTWAGARGWRDGP